MNPIKAAWLIAGNFVGKLILERHLIASFVRRDLRARYIGSFMGIFWSVVHPLVLLLSYTFVFSIVFKIRPGPEAGTSSFALYLFCGILPWLFFQDTVQRSAGVVIDNARLISKAIFPTEILPVTVLAANLVNHLIGLAILLAILAFSPRQISLHLLALPLYFLPLALFTLGFSWSVAALNVFVRDTAQVLAVVLTFWFWFTPIFYPPGWVPEQFASFVNWNPLAPVVTGYRELLLLGRLPALEGLALSYGAGLAAFVAGGLFFRYAKREFVDVI